MSHPVEKALWFIENRFEGELSVDDIAGAAGLSRFHLSRLFALVVGQSLTRYARARRLSEAARALAGGAPDILAVALAAGYGSHEAFTRAFREHFGVTPESVRAKGDLNGLALTEPLRMPAQTRIDLAAPRFKQAPALLVVGLGARYAQGGDPAIALQWHRFAPHIGHVSGQVGDTAYGVVANFDENNSFDYVAGVEVRDFGDVPDGFASIRIPAHRYAVFTHRGHVSGIPSTMAAIWRDWLPRSGHRFADAPFFERYDHRFDPRTGNGEVELWLPLED
jgi:AraC family transcriptional regulator